MSFKNLNLINPIVRASTEAGYSKPTEIQYAAIPHILLGRDVIGYADTGKTAAYAMPVIQLLKRNTPQHDEIRTLILTPTRETVMQIEEDFKIYSKYLPLSQFSIFDGVLHGSQLAALRKRVDVLIATPGRLLELTNQRHIDLSKLEILVVDESQTVQDQDFIKDVKSISKLISQKRQTLFFSGTMSPQIKKLADVLLKNPVEITVSPNDSEAQNIQQSEYFAGQNEPSSFTIPIVKKVKPLNSLIYNKITSIV